MPEESGNKVKQFYGLDIESLTAESILTEETIRVVFSLRAGFHREKLLSLLENKARELKVLKAFRGLVKAMSLEMEEEVKGREGNMTEFPGQSAELYCDEWVADAEGVRIPTFNRLTGAREFAYACPHPLLITERYYNISNGTEKAKLEYYRDGQWKSVTVGKSTIASALKIVDLAKYGILVTSENARHMVRYLHELEILNPEEIKHYTITDKFGWMGGGEFVPYSQTIQFDGEQQLTELCECVREEGRFDEWLEVVQWCRERSEVRLEMSASFAGPLLTLIGKPPFFVHLYGRTESGKTVAMMVAASIWGNPDTGKLLRGLNSTQVGLERISNLMNHIPVFLNELQTVRFKDKMEDVIYQLCEGKGRERGTKSGTLEKMTSWCTCFLTNGESSLLNEFSGEGAQNRVIEIQAEGKLFTNPSRTAETIKKNYGHAGKRYIAMLAEMGRKELCAKYESWYETLAMISPTEKQAMAGAVLLTADGIAADLLGFRSKLTMDDVLKNLKSPDDMDRNKQALELIQGWIAANKNKLVGLDPNVRLGDIKNGVYYVMAEPIRKLLHENGFNYKDTLSYLAAEGVIKGDGNKSTYPYRINDVMTRCLRFVQLQNEPLTKQTVMELPPESEEPENLPF